jgi:hypothetical protein
MVSRYQRTKGILIPGQGSTNYGFVRLHHPTLIDANRTPNVTLSAEILPFIMSNKLAQSNTSLLQ